MENAVSVSESVRNNNNENNYDKIVSIDNTKLNFQSINHDEEDGERKE